MCKWCPTLTPLGGGSPGLRQPPPLRSHIPCAHEEIHGLQAHQPARMGRQRPPEARVARAHLRARADHPEYAEFGDSVRRAQQAHANMRPMPACGPVVVARSRREPRSHAVDGLARPDATDRRHLHSRKDACTFQTCAPAGMTQDSCRTHAASSHLRHNSQYSRRTGRWLGLALGYRQPWLRTCGIRSRHAVSAH